MNWIHTLLNDSTDLTVKIDVIFYLLSLIISFSIGAVTCYLIKE